MSERVTIEVGQTRGQPQLSINVVDAKGWGTGYRIAGPKFDGTGTTSLTRTLTARDAAEIRRALDRVFPAPAESAAGDEGATS